MTEVLNVITHGVPAVYYAARAVMSITSDDFKCPSHAMSPDELSLLHFLGDFGAAACFGISTAYHLTGRTPKGLKWDLSGISFLLAICILLPVHSACGARSKCTPTAPHTD